ncbi:unnamed protein product [Durusdinium trenchii]|uniref:Chloroplastic (Starch-related R1 protein) n=2 Tax=Durusdinium trenchii TaxID=1381693 RepID=A0ABP0KT86_9DINO
MPTYPIDGGAEIAVNPSGGFGKAPLSLNFQCRHVRRMLSINSGGFAGRLHWAVLNADGAWQAPAVQPDGSQDCDGTASSAHLNGDGNVTMTFRSGQVPEKITFVLVIEVGGQTHWLKGPGGENFVVDVAALAAEVGGGGLGGEARVAPREPTWPELEKAKAAVASAAKSDTSAPVVRRRRAKAPAMVNSSDLFVKAGEMQVEQGLGSIKWTATVGADEVNVFLEALLELSEDAEVSLHWGAAPSAGSEWQPIDTLPSNCKAFDDVAARVVVPGQARLVLSFKRAQAPKAPRWLSFVLYIKFGSGELWLKRDGGDNFWVPVLATGEEVPQTATSEQSLSQRFCQAETRYQHFTQFQRLCACSDVLAAEVDFEAAAWIATVLCLADAKALEWYRKSGYQPKDMAHAQERIGGVMSAAVSNAQDPRIRTLLRLAVKAVPRGSSGGGDAIRHGILNIMRTHGIKEGHRPGIECKFIEQWHQKLHTNSAPDDIAICEGYLAYLSSGNVDEMYRVMWECGKLTREDLGKMCQMGFKDHTKSGGRGLNFTPVHLPHMYNDVKSFLGLLKHVHGGSDLFSLCEACKGQYPDHESECLAFDIFHSRDDPFSMGKILDLRRRLEPLCWKRDILMLDVAMEEQLRSLAERSNVAEIPRDGLLTFIFQILEDLMMSRHDPSLQQGYALLQKLMQQSNKWTPEWCKMLHAAFDRIALTCTATADVISTALQNCADELLEAGSKPGAVFCPDSKHLGTFGEEKARCLTERVLAQTLKVFMPQVRRWSGLGPWEVVAAGGLGGAVGILQSCHELPTEAPSEAQLLVLETMTGWEDIPANINAILLPAGQAVDTLSHVAIRARNQEVLLASCDEEQQLQELRKLQGQNLRLQVSATGEVTWTATSEKSKLKDSSAAAFLAETMQPPPPPPSAVLKASDFTKNPKSIGGKSLHLAELMADGTYRVPTSATIPYGIFEQALKDKANEGLEEELQEVLAEGDMAEARKFLEEELAVPSSVRPALDAALGEASKALDAGDWQRALKRVWASKWTDRAVASREQMKVPDKALYLAVLVQPVVHARYAFVIHTRSPLPGASPSSALVELCVGLGESLVSNAPGRALSASVEGQAINVHVYPSKPEGVFVPPGGTAIFRSDSNGEDLEGFAGAGLYDSVTVKDCEHRSVDYAEEPLFFDEQFRSQLLLQLFQIGRQIEKNFGGQAQDIEGAVAEDGTIVITQSRPQV